MADFANPTSGSRWIVPSLLKNVCFAKQKGFQFRVAMFNAFNHPDFGLPGAIFGVAGFGVVSSARSGRTIQLGLRLAF